MKIYERNDVGRVGVSYPMVGYEFLEPYVLKNVNDNTTLNLEKEAYKLLVWYLSLGGSNFFKKLFAVDVELWKQFVEKVFGEEEVQKVLQDLNLIVDNGRVLAVCKSGSPVLDLLEKIRTVMDSYVDKYTIYYKFEDYVLESILLKDYDLMSSYGIAYSYTMKGGFLHLWDVFYKDGILFVSSSNLSSRVDETVIDYVDFDSFLEHSIVYRDIMVDDIDGIIRDCQDMFMSVDEIYNVMKMLGYKVTMGFKEEILNEEVSGDSLHLLVNIWDQIEKDFIGNDYDIFATHPLRRSTMFSSVTYYDMLKYLTSMVINDNYSLNIMDAVMNWVVSGITHYKILHSK